MPLAGLPVPQLLSLSSSSLFLLSTLLDIPAGFRFTLASLPSNVRELFGSVGFSQAYHQHTQSLVIDFGSKVAVNAPIPATRVGLRSQALRPLSPSATIQSNVSSQNARAAPVTDTVSPMRSPQSAFHSPFSASPVPLVMHLRPRSRRPTSPSASSGNGAGAAPGLLFFC